MHPLYGDDIKLQAFHVLRPWPVLMAVCCAQWGKRQIDGYTAFGERAQAGAHIAFQLFHPVQIGAPECGQVLCQQVTGQGLWMGSILTDQAADVAL